MNRFCAIALFAAVLAGCGGSNSNSSVTPPPPPPPPPTTTSFTTFVHTELAQTSNASEPENVNDVMFTFPDDDDPTAFDDVLGGP
ncbi:MAG: hypothetical protein ACREPX_00025 [Rhodanobacteraceae bacterium]